MLRWAGHMYRTGEIKEHAQTSGGYASWEMSTWITDKDLGGYYNGRYTVRMGRLWQHGVEC
jgi:hypothetical protein